MGGEITVCNMYTISGDITVCNRHTIGGEIMHTICGMIKIGKTWKENNVNTGSPFYKLILYIGICPSTHIVSMIYTNLFCNNLII